MNTIGTCFRITLFGSSHGPGIGCILDGVPADVSIPLELLQRELDRRKPSPGIGTSRKEEDAVELLSGVQEERTTGAPITIFIRNRDADSAKYKKFRRIPRPGHADFTAMRKYGESHDLRGGGQFSGRMTAPLVVAGTIAKLILHSIGVDIAAYAQSIGKVADAEEHSFEDIKRISRLNPARAASQETADLMIEEILDVKRRGDSVGGVVRCLCINLPIGVGEPFFDSLESEISKMIFSIPGVKGVEFGAGFRAASMRGSEHNDPFVVVDGTIKTITNNAGGVLGGLSTGMPLDFRVAFKPTASISKEQRSVDLESMEDTTLKVEGRHDPCIVPRAVVVVEASAAIVLADLCIRGGFIA
jgi:chorismate synthase